MTKRKSLSRKVRFEVFKRDTFSCVYCEQRAPDVVLQVDHVHPIAKGGTNDLLNLVTACDSCNSGKSARTLDDASVVRSRMSQAAALQAKREQIEMIADWQRGLAGLQDAAINEASSYYNQLVPGWHLNETGLSKLRLHLAKHGLAEVMSAIRTSAAKHVRIGTDGRATEESSTIACRVMLSSLQYKQARDANPVLSDLRYIAGIARNRFNWCPSNHRRYIEECHTQLGIQIETLRQLVFECRNWSQFEVAVKEEVER